MTTLATQSAVDSKIYAVCDIMRRSNSAPPHCSTSRS